jgi:NADH:ubiquinone oxidoreductase subunit 3 (subunit A)
MFWEWLERTLFGIAAILFFIVVVAVVFLMGALWLLLYEAVAWLAILALVVFVGVPIATFIYTIYENWFLVTEFFENLKEKWDSWRKKNV